MTQNELSDVNLIESIETIDVLNEDVIEGLAANRWGAREGQVLPKVFVITEGGRHAFAELIDGNQAEDVDFLVLFAPRDLFRRSGETKQWISKTYLIGPGEEDKEEAEFNASIHIA